MGGLRMFFSQRIGTKLGLCINRVPAHYSSISFCFQSHKDSERVNIDEASYYVCVWCVYILKTVVSLSLMPAGRAFQKEGATYLKARWPYRFVLEPLGLGTPRRDLDADLRGREGV